MKKSMAIVRPSKPNLAEISIYRAFLEHFNLTFFFSGVHSTECRSQLDAFGLQDMKLVRYRSVSELVPSRVAQRALDYKVGLGTYMVSHLSDVLCHDYINVVDPAYGYTHQITRSIRPDQKLIVVRWENIYGRYNRVWTAARRAKRVLDRADFIICVSQAALSTICLENGYAPKTLQIYPGIDMRSLPAGGFQTSGRNENSSREKPRPVVLFVGRLQWTKGLQALLVALRILNQLKKLESDLCVIGGGDTTPFEALADELGVRDRVQFLGRASNEEVRAKMREVDLFCFPSLLTPNWMEQYGFALVEAMAHGLPVVAFDSGSIREICDENAVYASTGNAHSLAEAIAWVIEHRAEAQERGKNLQRRAFHEFDADEQGRKMLEAIL